MKNTITLIALLVVVSAFAQISVKAEYIGNSKFYDAVADTNTGDGSATIYSASAMHKKKFSPSKTLLQAYNPNLK